MLMNSKGLGSFHSTNWNREWKWWCKAWGQKEKPHPALLMDMIAVDASILVPVSIWSEQQWIQVCVLKEPEVVAYHSALGCKLFSNQIGLTNCYRQPLPWFSMLLQVRQANRLFPVKWWGAVSVWDVRLCARVDLGIALWEGTLFRQALRKECSAWLELRNVSPPWLLWPWGPWQPCWPQPSHSITLCQLQLINRFWLCCLLYFWGRIRGAVHSIDRALSWGMSERSRGVSPIFIVWDFTALLIDSVYKRDWPG